MLKENKERVVAFIVLVFYTVTLVPAVEHQSAFSKGKIRLEQYLERASESGTEERFNELAEYGFTQALAEWESEYLLLRDFERLEGAGDESEDLETARNKVKKEYELIKADSYIKFITNRYIKEKTITTFSELSIRLKKASESDEYRFSKENAFTDLEIMESWNKKALSIVDEYVLEVDEDSSYNRDLIKAKNDFDKKRRGTINKCPQKQNSLKILCRQRICNGFECGRKCKSIYRRAAL